MLQRGANLPQGRAPGLQDLMSQLRKRRQQALDRYDLGSALEEIQRKLDQVIATEREGIEQRVQDPGERARRAQELDRLPPDPAGRIRELMDHAFVEPEAERLFRELLESLREQALKPFMQGMQQAVQDMSPEDLRRLREMLQDLTRMLRQRAQGEEPDFQPFKERWGQHFPGVESLDELIEHLRRQMAAMQSLLSSLTPGQRSSLEEMMRSLMLRDERLEAAMRQFTRALDQVAPLDDLARSYEFRGDQDLSLEQALELMADLGRMDELERQLRRAQSPEDLDRVDPAEVERLLGQEARQDLERLREIARKLEEAGYLERQGARLALTARATRKIADKALRDIFAHLKRDRVGRHAVERRGAGGDPSDESKPYEFGDPFLLDLRETLMQAVARGGPGTPVRLAPGDFHVHRTELSTRAATVVMLDLSRSMLYNGCFAPAKKVALALHALIKNQFPRDSLHVVGFSLYAREFDPAQLPGLGPSETAIGTNMHAGFLLSRQLLARHRGSNKQIIMVTDGEPTAHLEGTEAEFAYPPTMRTFRETLKEVQRCTREGITINTFMLEQSSQLTAFVEQMARINHGRAFLTSPDRLGEYVLVDYVRGRRRRAS
jgi:uncharacterized protein with von Willebrand factor type A (vWA) domain